MILVTVSNNAIIDEAMASTSPSNGPLISQNIAVASNQLYNVNLDVTLTDLDSSTEYLDIFINGTGMAQNITGTCNPNYGQASCDWYTCTISPTQAFSTNQMLAVQLQYSSAVGSFATCSYMGQTGHAVARVTLTPSGKLEFWPFMSKENSF